MNMNLNDNQIMAINHLAGPCICIAGPGSGKTLTLTLRLQRLVDMGIDGSSILVITFTRAAALEMKERFLKLTGDSSVVFGTFHSAFYGMLKEEHAIDSYEIISSNRRYSLIKEAFMSVIQEEYSDDLADNYLREISYMKNIMAGDDYKSKSVNSHNLWSLYKEYERLKRNNKLMDYDDMLTLTYELFVSNKEALSRWQERFKYILIDEAQDMNELQYNIVKLLSLDRKNIFLVGDDDQSIYGFRGANPGIMQQFREDYNSKVIVLDTNYRCPRNIVDVAAKLISHNTNRFAKNINSIKADGMLSIHMLSDEKEESEYVLHALEVLCPKREDYSNCAILYRNHIEASSIVEGLIQSNIPFFLKDHMPNIYEHFVMDDMISFFRLAQGQINRVNLLKVINKPQRYIARAAITNGDSIYNDLMTYYRSKQWMLERINNFFYDIKRINNLSAYAACNYIRKAMGYDDYLVTYALDNGKNRDEYLNIADFFMEVVRECRSIEDAIVKISECKKVIALKNEEQKHSKVEGVGLYTMHSSKGLEFDNVFIIRVNEQVIPSKKAITDAELEEERRMLYVAITRAKSKLFITGVNNKKREKVYPSRFISELDNYSSPSSSSSIHSSCQASKASDTASYSSSDSMLSKDGLPFSSSK